MEEIPKWVIDYNNAGYQSGAGRAVKLLMEKVEKLEAERSELVKENERLKNDLLDALDLKEGKGPTALSMQAERIKQLEAERSNIETLLHKILKESVGGNVPFSFELYNEIKAALKL